MAKAKWRALVESVRGLSSDEKYAAVIALALDMRGTLAGCSDDDCNGGGLPDFHEGVAAGIAFARELRPEADADGTFPPAPPHDWESAKAAVDGIVAGIAWAD